MFRTLNTMFTGSESKEQPFQYYLVLDFESTCQEGTKIDPQEIIEFPCLLIRSPDFVLVDQVVMNNIHLTFWLQFHEYIRPVAHPVLTKFCTDLTGITQDMIQVSLGLVGLVSTIASYSQ